MQNVRLTELFMKIKTFGILISLLLSACSASIPKAQLDKYAFIRSGSTNFFSLTSGGSSVSLTAIDGKPMSMENETLAVDPGKRNVTMECGGVPDTFEITFNAGDIYEYAVARGGSKGCAGRLFKVN